VKYDMQSIGSAASLARLRGTVLGSLRLWLHVILYVAIAGMVAVAVGLLAERPELVAPDRVGEAVNYFCLFVSIALSFHVFLAVERWWELRNRLIGELWRATNDLTMVLAVHFPSREHRRLKTLILRYCLLSFELMFMQARDGQADLHELCSRHLLRDDERERLEQLAAQPQVVWVWIAGTFQRLAQAGKLPSRLLANLYETCARARSSVAGIFAHLSTQLPYSYVHLISVVVHANNLLVAVKCGTMAAVAVRSLLEHHAFDSAVTPSASGATSSSSLAAAAAAAAAGGIRGVHGSGQGSGEAAQVLLLQCLQAIFVPLATVGLLEVATLVGEPFGSSFQDFPRSAYHVWMRDECEAFQTAAEEAPKELSFVVDAVEAKEARFVHDRVCAV